jgi:hypothetical protein
MDKNSGIEYDREAFLPAPEQTPPGVTGLKGLIILLAGVVLIAVCGFLGYRVMGGGGGPTSSDTRALVQLDFQLAQIEDRLDRLEQEHHRLAASKAPENSKKTEAVTQEAATSNTPPRVVYRVSPSISQQPSIAVTDPSTTQRLTALQKDLGAAQDDASANREAWQATTDRLADVAGQVGSQHGEILRGQDDLNRILAQTQRSALPFELHRGSSPQELGPVTIELKTTNPKNQRYTICVYINGSCVELKDRTLYEVVQVALSRNSPPLQVIATTVRKDGITGYLEVPRASSWH